MNTTYPPSRRMTVDGVATAAILVTILAMAGSLLAPTEAPIRVASSPMKPGASKTARHS